MLSGAKKTFTHAFATPRENEKFYLFVASHETLRRTNHLEACLAGHDVGQCRLYLDDVIIDGVDLIEILHRFDIACNEQHIFIR